MFSVVIAQSSLKEIAIGFASEKGAVVGFIGSIKEFAALALMFATL